MEKEERAKVILDYDKYQELLTKANLIEETIKEIKDAAFKEGYDKGYNIGNGLCQLKVRQTHFGLLKVLDGCFKDVPLILCLEYVVFMLIVSFKKRLNLM